MSIPTGPRPLFHPIPRAHADARDAVVRSVPGFPGMSFEEKMRNRRGMDAITPELRARLRAADGRRGLLAIMAGRGAALLAPVTATAGFAALLMA